MDVLCRHSVPAGKKGRGSASEKTATLSRYCEIGRCLGIEVEHALKASNCTEILLNDLATSTIASSIKARAATISGINPRAGHREGAMLIAPARSGFQRHFTAHCPYFHAAVRRRIAPKSTGIACLRCTRIQTMPLYIYRLPRPPLRQRRADSRPWTSGSGLSNIATCHPCRSNASAATCICGLLAE